MNFGEFVRTLEGGPEPVGTFNAYDAALTLGYATKLGTDWGVGFNFRIIHSRLLISQLVKNKEQVLQLQLALTLQECGDQII